MTCIAHICYHEHYNCPACVEARREPEPPQKRRQKRDKRSTAIRLAMRRLRARRRAKGLNAHGGKWGGKDAKYLAKKWRKL